MCIDQRQLTRPNFNQSLFKQQQQDQDPRQPPAEIASSGEHSFQPAQGYEGNGSAPSKKHTGQQQQEQPLASHAIYAGTRTSILSQTAKADVYSSENPESKANVRLILDSGSQHSFVTTRVKNQLNLKLKGMENLLVKTF